MRKWVDFLVSSDWWKKIVHHTLDLHRWCHPVMNSFGWCFQRYDTGIPFVVRKYQLLTVTCFVGSLGIVGMEKWLEGNRVDPKWTGTDHVIKVLASVSWTDVVAGATLGLLPCDTDCWRRSWAWLPLVAAAWWSWAFHASAILHVCSETIPEMRNKIM